MDVPTPAHDDVLEEPIRRRLFEILAELRRFAGTEELAVRVDRHPNTTRVHLRRLSEAGLVEQRKLGMPRGRPRHEWSVATTARPAGQPPEAHATLGAWLARAARKGGGLAAAEETGREIGRELAPEAGNRSLRETMDSALSALGFAPRSHGDGAALCFVLGNCPYREAVAANQPLVCSLHRGMTEGLLERLDRSATLSGFVAKDPYTAGCEIHVRPQA